MKIIKSFFIAFVVLACGIGAWLVFYSTTFTEKVTIQGVQDENTSDVVPAITPTIETTDIQRDSENKADGKKNEVPDRIVKEAGKEESDSSKADTGQPSIISNLVSWGFRKESADRKIDTVVIHSSYDGLGDNPYNLDGILKEYKQYGVAAHYIIDRKGTIYRLVKDDDVAYHAGISKVPDGRSNVNEFSTGIELMNTEKDSYTDAQYASLNTLIADLKAKNSIKYVVTHKQIAPGRKTDPWNFDESRLK